MPFSSMSLYQISLLQDFDRSLNLSWKRVEFFLTLYSYVLYTTQSHNSTTLIGVKFCKGPLKRGPFILIGPDFSQVVPTKEPH